MTLSIRLPSETAKSLNEVSRLSDRPKSYIVMKALQAYLGEYADYQIALDRLRDKDDAIVSSEEMQQRLLKSRAH